MLMLLQHHKNMLQRDLLSANKGLLHQAIMWLLLDKLPMTPT